MANPMDKYSLKIKIKNRTYYFFNGMINIKEVDSSLLKIDKTLVFTTSDILQSTKLMTMKICTA